MNLQFALDSYRSAGPASEVDSASRFRLIQILMEHGLKSLSAAASADGDQQQVARRAAIGKAIDAIETLRQSLHEAPADASLIEQLNALYGHMIEELLKAVAETGANRVRHVGKLLATLKSAWDELPKRASTEPGLKGYFS
ncbi:MAG: flagellar export chaperone FliS [Pseudomonadota bacterium]